jgi:hypothetical protein
VAERAGLKRHDVIVSIDGQLLLLPEQFVTLLEASAADAPLECRLLRGGVEKVVTLRKQIVAPRAVTTNLKPAESSLALVPRKSPTTLTTVTQLPDGSLQERDARYLVRLTAGDEQRLLVKDARGRIVFHGAIDTPEQRSRVPPEVRDRVAGLERLVARQQAIKRANDDVRPKPPEARIGTLDIKPVEIR